MKLWYLVGGKLMLLAGWQWFKIIYDKPGSYGAMRCNENVI